MSRIRALLFLLALAAQVPLASATVTYQVGACLPKLTSFTTIQGALNATPTPNLVEVCPGSYPEQVVVGFPVTIEGISAGGATGAMIVVPPGGLKVSATTDLDASVAAQVFVQSGGQEVNLSNVTIDGTGNNVSAGVVIAGAFYLGSSGTLDHLTIQNQNGNGEGVGVMFQGGMPVASVTVENSSMQGFDNGGITGGTNTGVSELTATIRDNYLTGGAPVCNPDCIPVGIFFGVGTTASITGNLITGGYAGIMVGSPQGPISVSKNTIVGSANGIQGFAGAVSVTSNAIYNTSATGIWGNALATGNTIVQSGTAIDFDCLDDTVHSNTILGAVDGIINVPPGLAPMNTYHNVGTISSGGC
jgi:hypothetical protein